MGTPALLAACHVKMSACLETLDLMPQRLKIGSGRRKGVRRNYLGLKTVPSAEAPNTEESPRIDNRPGVPELQRQSLLRGSALRTCNTGVGSRERPFVHPPQVCSWPTGEWGAHLVKLKALGICEFCLRSAGGWDMPRWSGPA